MYESLLKPYARAKVKLFRQYLPALLYLPDSSLTSFEDAIKAASQQNLDSETIKLQDHLLYKFLEDGEKKLLESWDQKFSAADLNRILAVYTEYGIKGLKRLDEVWKQAIQVLPKDKTDDSILQDLKKYYFRKCNTYLPCLDPEFAKALTIIKSFSASERYIWDEMFQQHCETVGFDNIYNLAQTFQALKKTVTETYKLSFPTKPKISKIKSLPVTLSRIKTILAATPERDRPLVFEKIFELDWQSNAASKIVADAELKPEGGVLVIPEQQMEAINYAKEHDYSSENWHADDKRVVNGYHSLKVSHRDPKSIITDFMNITSFDDTGRTENPLMLFGICKDSVELDRNYYRYIASRPERKSLDFYKQASKLINQKFANSTMRGVFHGLIAASSSSFESSLKEETDEILLKKVQKTVSVFDKCGLPDFFKISVLKSLANAFFPPPPLEYLEKIFSLLQLALNIDVRDVVHPLKIIKKIDDLSTALDKIKLCSHGVNRYAFYEGIQFYDFEATSIDDFCKICHLASTISAFNVGNFSFVSLISTFNLDENFAPPIPDNPLVNECLNLLTQMNPGTPSKLKQAELIEFIEEIDQKYKQDASLKPSDELVLNLIKQKFGKYFKSETFEKLFQIELSKELIGLIQANFPVQKDEELVKSLLASFSNVSDTQHRVLVFKAIVKICANLNADEQKAFLETLALINVSKKESLEDLANLLVLMGESRRTADFILLMKQGEKPPSLALISKYYKEVLPIIYLKNYGSLKISEIQSLALAFLKCLKPDEFLNKFKESLTILERLSIRYPSEKSLVLTMLASFMEKEPDLDILKFINYLDMDDSNALRSLCEHYVEKPKELYELFAKLEKIEPQELDPDKKSQKKAEMQAQLLAMISMLANNNKVTKLEQVDGFLAKPELFAQTKALFDSPPYPDFEQILSWHKDNKLAASYLAFQKSPSTREEANVFKKKEARDFANKFKGVEFEDTEIDELEEAILLAQKQSIADLKNELSTASHMKRLVILAELLYRSKATKDNSFELNAVQYLTILTYLKTGGHITAEMATGEGKSRTMMMALACQVLMGKTVDFITSDMQLAARDYLEYQSFFKMIGAETSLIYSSSAPKTYKIGGINFSDASNLSLFRNKARSAGKGASVIDANPQNRALILDEADKTYFDISETRFNFSDLPKDSLTKDMAWTYPLLIKFFTQAEAKDKTKIIFEFYKNDIDACNDAFFDFVKAQDGISDEMLINLENLPNNQIETWHDAAITALNLKLGEDYTIEPNVVVETVKGPKLASEARLIYGSRIAPNSKFSFGVHQCLHALLNQEITKPDSPTTLKCQEVLKKKGSSILPFHIEAEKQIIYSSTSKSLLDEYKEGDVWGITGTAGAIIEREEAGLLYPTLSKDGPSSLMQFITVPRLKGLQRADKPIHLTKNFEKRMETILEYILEAHAANRPVLLIAESDLEAQKIKEALQKLAGEKVKNWNFVDALTSTKEESETIAQAGGLRVICSFLPRVRDLEQIFGRSGRYGAKGDARIVVDKAQLKSSFKSKTIRLGFFLSTEFFIKSKQAEEDKRQQVERLLRQVLSDFRVKITDSFFKHYDTAKTGLSDWSNCTKEIDQLWAKAQIDLQELLAKPKLDITKINAHLEEFRADSQKFWSILNSKIGGVLTDLDKIELSPTSQHLLKSITPKRLYTVADQAQVYKAYEKSLDGRAAIYDDIFMEFKNIRAGKRKIFANTRASLEGTGIVFANSRAVLTGKRPLFANLRAWMSKSKQKKQELGLVCKTILQALEKYNQEDLRRLLKTESARDLITGSKFLLPMKIELVEVLLGYMHKKAKISHADMDVIKNILDKINEVATVDEIENLPIRGRFFSAAVKREFNHIILAETKSLK